MTISKSELIQRVADNAAKIVEKRKAWIDEEFAALFPNHEESFKSLSPIQVEKLLRLVMHRAYNEGICSTEELLRPEIMKESAQFVKDNPILTAKPGNTAH